MVISPWRVAARAVEALVGARRKPPVGAWKAEARASMPTCGGLFHFAGWLTSLFLFRVLGREGGLSNPVVSIDSP